MTIYYTGIGSRSTPKSLLPLFEKFGTRFAELNFCLRSGSSPGADQAFERGCKDGPKEIYLPRPVFEFSFRMTQPNNQSDFKRPQKEAYEIAKDLHPYWGNLNQYAHDLLARNVHQILGPDLQKPVYSSFVVLWTLDGAETAKQCNINTGGPATAIHLADKHSIPVVNFYNYPRAIKRLKEIVEALKEIENVK